MVVIVFQINYGLIYGSDGCSAASTVIASFTASNTEPSSFGSSTPIVFVVTVVVY